MKIAFFSNFLNHHQLPLCIELFNNEKHEFVFVACTKIPEDRVKMGYKNLDDDFKFVVKAYEDEKKAVEIAVSFDICIFGADCEKYTEMRMKKNLLSFRYIERIFKKGKWRYFVPKIHKKIKKQYLDYKNKNFYILCASGFTASDLVFCGFPAIKCFQWGYFPNQAYLTFNSLQEKKSKEIIKIVYVGRLLKLKKVDTIIKAFNVLSKKNRGIELNIVGDGPEIEQLKKLTNRINNNKIFFLGYKSIEETRNIIESSHILVLASNFYEGWGAVVNESLSSGCIPICSHSVGSAPVLLKDNVNGFIFELGNYRELAIKMIEAIQNISNYSTIPKHAYETIETTWNAKEAARRFLRLTDCIIHNRKTNIFIDGPCSQSKIIKNNWYRRSRK